MVQVRREKGTSIMKRVDKSDDEILAPVKTGVLPLT